MDALTAWDRGPIVCRFLSFFTFTKFRFRCLPLLCIPEQLMRSTFELQNLFVFAYVTQVDTYTVLSVGARYSLAIPMQTMLMMRTTTGKEYQYIYIYIVWSDFGFLSFLAYTSERYLTNIHTHRLLYAFETRNCTLYKWFLIFFSSRKEKHNRRLVPIINPFHIKCFKWKRRTFHKESNKSVFVCAFSNISIV